MLLKIICAFDRVEKTSANTALPLIVKFYNKIFGGKYVFPRVSWELVSTDNLQFCFLISVALCHTIPSFSKSTQMCMTLHWDTLAIPLHLGISATSPFSVMPRNSSFNTHVYAPDMLSLWKLHFVSIELCSTMPGLQLWRAKGSLRAL